MNRNVQKGILGLALWGVLVAGGWAQETGRYNQYLGWGGGTSTGVGLAYRSWPGDFGFQVMAVPVVSNDFQFGSLGVTGLWTLQDLQWTKFFSYAAANTMGFRSTTSSTWEARTALGAGIGFELVWFDHIAFDIMAGYGFHAVFPNMQTVGTTFTVESGLFYRTKL